MAELEYLLEVRSEELPPGRLRRLSEQLTGRLFEELMGLGLAPEEMLTGCTPRRLTVCCRGLPDKEPDGEQRLQGPPADQAWGADGEPTPALLGFAERVGADVGDLVTVQTEKGEYLARIEEARGRPLAEVLAEVVPRILGDLSFGPEMRWRGDATVWGRPVRGVLSLLSSEVVPLELDGAKARASTAGHPVLSPRAFKVRDFGHYLQRLRRLKVEPVFKKRRQKLQRRLRAHEKELGGERLGPPELLDRWTANCEIPGTVAGRFDRAFLELPEEMLTAVLNQRLDAFGLRKKGKVQPFFITVMDRWDDPEGRVQRGQETAATGHLADARYHYRADRRKTLAERARQLEHLTIPHGLGHRAAQTERLVALAGTICDELGWEEVREAAAEAALLAKADLTTHMVQRSPSLRGLVGGIYAREEGYGEGIWQAIYDHYLPLSDGEPLPRGRAGRVVALAWRIDRLVGFFGSGESPTGSKDPHGLRRTAQGLLRILLEAEISLDLDLVAARSALLFGDALPLSAEEILERLRPFLVDRTRQLFGSRGRQHDEIEAALAVRMNDLPDLAARIEALHQVRGEPTFRRLVEAAKRIFNLVGDLPEYELDPRLLEEPAEVELHRTLDEVRSDVQRAVKGRRYAEGLRCMEGLAQLVDRFLNEVLVMDDNERRRQNRVALLQATRRVFWRIARLKEMVVEAPEGGAT